jgi:hypothetical protein
MPNPNSQLSPQQTTPQRMFVGVEGSVAIIHRHLQCQQYPEACKAAQEFLAESAADPLQLDELMVGFQQKIAEVLPGLTNNSLATAKSASMLLAMLVTLAAHCHDDRFFGLIFSTEHEVGSPSLLLQHACSVVGCSVHIMDSIYQKIQKSGNSSLGESAEAMAHDISDLCKVKLSPPHSLMNFRSR